MSRTDEFRTTSGVAEEAASWFVRLQNEAARGDDWRAFERWLAASPANVQAYERLEGLWVDLDYVPVARELGGRPLLAARRRAPPRGASRRALFGGGLAIAAGLVVAVGVGLWPASGVSTQA